jgi:hypothetical protein
MDILVRELVIRISTLRKVDKDVFLKIAIEALYMDFTRQNQDRLDNSSTTSANRRGRAHARSQCSGPPMRAHERP